MSTKSLSGKDTITINDRVLVDFADGDSAVLTFPNEIMNVKTGKNGNSIYAYNETGKQVDVDLRIILGSSDDKFLNSLFANMKQDPPSFILMTGEFVKRVGDGSGNVNRNIYSLSGGVFRQEIDVKENVEGDTEQSVALYRLRFTNAPRSIE
jgi:hypothetical protein